MRRLPYYAISEQPIIESIDASVLLPSGAEMSRKGDLVPDVAHGNILGLVIGQTKYIQMRDSKTYISKPLYRADAQQLFNDYHSTDAELIQKFRDKYYNDKNFNW